VTDGVAVTPPLLAAVFASGSGTNFQALFDHQSAASSWRITLLFSDRESAGALGRARVSGVETAVVPVKDRSPEDVSRDTLEVLRAHDVDVLLLSGYLRLLPLAVISRFRRRILNIHPALLPEFGGKGMYGMNVHHAVVEAGVPMTGATVHYADEEYDTGPIIAQWPVPVRPGDNAEDVAARVLEVEHLLYPVAVDHVCDALVAGRDPESFDPLSADLS
jgi:formyltetrahydrofolate-dependent phosphoribosylglycinamide formyltransferase